MYHLREIVNDWRKSILFIVIFGIIGLFISIVIYPLRIFNPTFGNIIGLLSNLLLLYFVYLKLFDAKSAEASQKGAHNAGLIIVPLATVLGVYLMISTFMSTVFAGVELDNNGIIKLIIGFTIVLYSLLLLLMYSIFTLYYYYKTD